MDTDQKIKEFYQVLCNKFSADPNALNRYALVIVWAKDYDKYVAGISDAAEHDVVVGGELCDKPGEAVSSLTDILRTQNVIIEEPDMVN